MRSDSGVDVSMLKVDGGASCNDALMQFQADLLGATVRRPVVSETTALGAAYLAGLAVGYWNDIGDVQRNWALERQFTPAMNDADRAARRGQWRRAVERSLDWAPHS
jgi:glycerol kinase